MKTKEMEMIVYVYKDVFGDDGCPFRLEGGFNICYGCRSLREVAKHIIDNIADGTLKGTIHIITRPSERILLGHHETCDKRFKSLSKEEQDKLRQYFNIGRVVG